MTDFQLYLAIGIPMLAVLASLTVSLVQVSGIREDMRSRDAAFREDMQALRADMRENMQAIRTDIHEIRAVIHGMLSK